MKWTLLKNTHAGYTGWKESHSGGIFFWCKHEMKSISLGWGSHLDEMSHLIQTAPKYCHYY